MREKGVGTVADLLFMAVLISTACALLIQPPVSDVSGQSGMYTHRVAQNTLLSLQKLPVSEIADFSYIEDLPPWFLTRERTLDRKTISQLIKKDVLFNPRWEDGNGFDIFETGDAFSDELNNVLRIFLDDLIGERFGYRLTIRLKTISLSQIRILEYEKEVEDIAKTSKKLCSESVNWHFSIPNSWTRQDSEVPSLSSDEEGKSLWRLIGGGIGEKYGEEFLEYFQKNFCFFGNYGVLKVTLELWSG